MRLLRAPRSCRRKSWTAWPIWPRSSLVTVVAGSTVPRCRLLDTMRAYGLEKLAETGEREWLARRHAEYYRDLFERAEAELDARPATEWLAEYGPNTDNLVIRSPSHPYTRGLLASRPSSDLVTRTRLPMIPGVPPDLAHLPPGCSFQPRCELALASCASGVPPEFPVADRHMARCFRVGASPDASGGGSGLAGLRN